MIGKIPLHSKILNVTHYDLDGAGCSILLKYMFDHIDILPASYADISKILNECVNFHTYDYVILTDITPEDREKLVQYKDKIVILDHHDTAMDLLDKKENWFVKEDFCATVLTKKYLEYQYKEDLSVFNFLTYIVNDYDMWIHDTPRSTFINELFWKYHFDNFVKRFKSGNTKIYEEELQYLKRRKSKYEKILSLLDIYEIKELNGILIISEDFINELASKYLKEDYSIVFVINPKNYKLSIRHSIDDLHIGNLVKSLNLGGGHKFAAGVNSTSMDEVENYVELIKNELKQILEV